MLLIKNKKKKLKYYNKNQIGLINLKIQKYNNYKKIFKNKNNNFQNNHQNIKLNYMN